MKIGYSGDPDTTASYYRFFLLKKGKTGANILDANLIQVALECHNIGGLAYLYHGTCGQKCVLLEVINEYVKKMLDARGWSSLIDLCPTRGVAPRRWLVGVTLSRNKSHTLFSIL
jgi:hypothetical protein